MSDFPQLVHTNDQKSYFGLGQCIFEFVWKSRFACSVCRLDQVTLHENFCAADGTASVHARRKPGQHCTMDFVPEAFSKNGYLEDEFMGVYKHNGEKYVGKANFKKRCNAIFDAAKHPFLKIVLDVLAVALTILILCIIFTCQKYRNVYNEYDLLRQRSSSSSSRVVDRNVNETELETRPQRRGGSQQPDRNTFGKRPADQIKDQDRQADTEIDIGDLDVDFA